jgi:hypothetical protein
MEQNQQEEAQKQAERFESIPWASLVPERNPNLRRYLAVALTVVVGVVLGVVGGRILRGDTGRSVVVSPPAAVPSQIPMPQTAQPTVAPAPSSLQAIVAEPTPSPVVNVPAPPRLYSEADLMAVMPEEEMRAAAMRAEWFVTDFFTVDGEASAGADVLAALPAGIGNSPLPHIDGGGISYVEWARAFFVEPLGPARYHIEVAFRSLAGPGPGQLVRGPVRAVSVEVRLGVDGETIVADYPAPIEMPPALQLEGDEVAEADAPPEILAEALAAASAVGSDPAVVLTGLDDDGWRIVVMVGDESGLRWPLAVRP